MKVMQLIITLLVSVIVATPHIIISQRQNIWYFGNMAGLDFNVNPPVPISSGLIAQEGTATTCSNDGALLFYSNGETIWDRQHQVMPNGAGLAGGASSAQGALIVPQPGSCHIFYMFTTEDHFTDGGLSYSIIDMCLNGGFGDVVTTDKNILLENRTAENLTAVLHANGEDIWILAHKLGSDEFLAYLLTASGLNMTPVKSAVGSSYPSDAYIGCLKATHKGDKIVSSASFRNIYELYDFNNATGSISNPVDLKPIIGNGRFVYGLEFSPNDSLLYLSTFFVSSDLMQMDLHSMQITNLQSISGHYHLGALQLGPDGKIYLARSNQLFLDVIHAPDVPGWGCNYDPAGQMLSPGTTSQLGFPNILPYTLNWTFQAPDLLPADTVICEDDVVAISLSPWPLCHATFLWEDGTTSAQRSISMPGIYTVEMNTYCGKVTDSMIVSEVLSPLVQIPNDTLCSGDTIVPDPELQDVQYLWSDQTNNPFFLPAVSGLHWLQVSNACLSFTDSFFVTLLSEPWIDLPDSVFCAGDTLLLHIPEVNEEILWSDGQKEDTIQITQEGLYWVRVSNLCHALTDTFYIDAKEKPQVQLTDTLICDGSSLLLNAHSPGAEYTWSDHSLEASLVVTTSGIYSVTVSNSCGDASSSMSLTTKDCDFNIIMPNVFSPNGDGINDSFYPVLSRETTVYHLQIFDRWGNLVFHSDHPGEKWDGGFRNKTCAPGVYTVILHCISVDGIENRLKGDVTLLR